jgi:hypothetical protein
MMHEHGMKQETMKGVRVPQQLKDKGVRVPQQHNKKNDLSVYDS